MKKLLFFLTIILISCSAWGAKIYLNPGTNWKADNARFAAYFFGNGEKWVSMNKANYDDNVYCCDIPSGFSKVIFCRMNPSNSTNNWNNKWNQTGDLIIPSDKNYFTKPNDIWNGATSSWGSYTEIVTYTLDKDKEIYYTNDKNWDKAQFIIGRKANNGDNYSTAYSMSKIENTNLYYYKTIEKWENYNEWSVFHTDGAWAGDYNSVTNRKQYSKDKNVGIGTSKLENLNLLSYDGKAITLNSYTSLNHTQTITVKTDDKESTTGGPIKASSYKLASASTTSVSSGSTSGATTTLSAAYTATVTLEATTKTGYKFVGWYEGSTEKSTNRTYTYTAENATKEITAHFELIKYAVDIYAPEGGSVVGADEKEYPYGTQLTFEAVPAPGYEFIKWSDDNTDNPRTIIVEEDINGLYPIFELKNLVFTNETDLEFATYGHLTYQLTMDENRWYWISLPFSVNIDAIEVIGGNGKGTSEDLVLTEYDAQTRADYGKGGWQNVQFAELTANQGYVIGPKDDAYVKGMIVKFPSTNTENTVSETADLSTSDTGGEAQHANWHIVGTGLYHSTTALENVNYIAVPNNNGDYIYYYVNAPAKDLFQTPFSDYTFKPFEAFFVQHGDRYIATADKTKSVAELAPIARAKAQQNEQIYCINFNETHTVVILNAYGSEGYTVGQDFLEMNASNHSDLIYSFDGSDALAFNHRATEAQSIALGGYVAVAGEQTISLKGYNANVESVTLVDNVTGETADLLAGDYTFNAEVGSLDGRFTVVFGAQKAGDTTVDCYNSTANQLIAYGSANACTVSGLTTGEAVVVYNAMGQLVFATIADSETITLPSLTTGNYLILHNGSTNKVALR